ncbi:hydrolase [Nannochloropsis oceanica]
MEDDEWQQQLWHQQEHAQALPPLQRVELKPRPGRPKGEPARAVSLLEIPRQRQFQKPQGEGQNKEQRSHEAKREEGMEEEFEEGGDVEEGEEEVVTVFLIHGAMATWRQFMRLLPSLSRYFRVVCFDAYGCGESPKPAGVDGSAFSTDELFEDLKEVYDRFKGKGGNILVGHSFGLVLLASAYHVPDGGNPIFTLPLPVLNLIKPIISQVFKSKAIDAHAPSSVWKEQARGNQGNPMYIVKAFYRHLRWATIETIHSLACPCEVVHGETDGIIPLYQGRALAANLLKANFHVFRETGHQVMQERPAETAALIIAAATKWSRARRRAGGKEGRRKRTMLTGKMVEEVEISFPQRIAKEEEEDEQEEEHAEERVERSEGDKVT